MFELKKGVPIPTRKPTRRSMYPFFRMEVGDSFDIPDDLYYQRVRYAARYAIKRGQGNFKVRKVQDDEDGYGKVFARCWRVS